MLFFIYSNCILHPYGSSNYNTKACKHIKEKQHTHNEYVNVGEIFDKWCSHDSTLMIFVLDNAWFCPWYVIVASVLPLSTIANYIGIG
jgi:hypothetical protein